MQTIRSNDNNLKEASKENPIDSIQLKFKKLESRVKLTLQGVGANVKYNTKYLDNSLIAQIYTSKKLTIVGGSQSLSMPSAGLKVATLEGFEKVFQLSLIGTSDTNFSNVNFVRDGEDLVLSLPVP